jgi:hypothetical protein
VDEALQALSQARAELQKREGEKAIVAQINSMTPTAALAALCDYREKLSALTDLSPQTARLRDEKLNQMSIRIQQYEQIADELPQAVERAASLSDVRQQRNLLLRTLDQLEGTRFHQPLVALREGVECLETFFEKLQTITSAPRRTPDDLTNLEAQLTDLETRFVEWLSPARRALLQQKRQEVGDLRRQKTQEAMTWLAQLTRCHTDDENPETLLRQTETPPAFLPPEGHASLEQFRLRLRQRLNENALLQIEALFQKIADPEMRRECLKRLQALVDAL